MEKRYKKLFEVPNTEEGRQWINYAKTVLNRKDYYIHLRGRHSNRKFLYSFLNKVYSVLGQNEVPLKFAERIAVYIHPHQLTRKSSGRMFGGKLNWKELIEKDRELNGR